MYTDGSILGTNTASDPIRVAVPHVNADWNINTIDNPAFIKNKPTILDIEAVQDIVGRMVTGNTETNIAVTYDDPTAKLNFSVNLPAGNSQNVGETNEIIRRLLINVSGAGFNSLNLTSNGQALSNGRILTDGEYTLVTVGEFDPIFIEDENFIALPGTSVGSELNSNNSIAFTVYKFGEPKHGIRLGRRGSDNRLLISKTTSDTLLATITTRQVSAPSTGKTEEEIQDIVGAMFTGNTDLRVTSTYDDASGKINITASVPVSYTHLRAPRD